MKFQVLALRYSIAEQNDAVALYEKLSKSDNMFGNLNSQFSECPNVETLEIEEIGQLRHFRTNVI